MIINFVLNAIVLILGAMFAWLPVVTSLPAINGFDIDASLVLGVSQMYSFFEAFWPLGLLFQGFIVLMGYFTVKLIVKFWIGHRAP